MQLASMPDILVGASLPNERVDATATEQSALVRLVMAGPPVTAMVSTVLAAGLLGPGSVSGAPGDLDPGFGDVGRVLPQGTGPVWALEAQDEDLIYAGGEYYCY